MVTARAVNRAMDGVGFRATEPENAHFLLTTSIRGLSRSADGPADCTLELVNPLKQFCRQLTENTIIYQNKVCPCEAALVRWFNASSSL